jgi:Zn-dependent peptidase ImmA (M78 family)/DNA-binding XRE family transcriptional regulator
MRRTGLAYITPDLLTWAIERSGMSRAELVKKIHVQESVLESWENGLAFPPFNKAREMAQVLRVAFGYFFLPQRPADEVPLPDLRRLPQSSPLKPSVDFLDVLYQAMTQHDWYRAYQIEEGASPVSFVGKFTERDLPATIATDIRTTLGMDNSLRRKSYDSEGYLTKLTQNAEKAGVIVMRRAVVGSSHRVLNRKEFQGFAISDPIAPLVFINGQDYQAAKVFTLLHELAHIWIGHSGISLIDETLQSPALQIELLCNAVAAETLVPRVEFESEWNSRQAGYEQMERLARHFLVSVLVIIRRATELNKISTDTSFEFWAEAKQRIEAYAVAQANEKEEEKEKAKDKQGGDFYATLEARNSSTFVTALLSDVKQGGTLLNDAARLLSMKVETVVKVTEGT